VVHQTSPATDKAQSGLVSATHVSATHVTPTLVRPTLVALVLLGLTAPLLAADWPMWRFDAARSGASPHALLNQLETHVLQHIADAAQFDDITMLALQRQAGSSV